MKKVLSRGSRRFIDIFLSVQGEQKEGEGGKNDQKTLELKRMVRSASCVSQHISG